MAEKYFTAKTAENLKPTGKPYKKSTGRGFYLYVSAVGGKTWRYDYRLNGKRNTVTYGRYPEMSLGEATIAHESCKKLLDNGVDPLASKKREQQEIKAAEQARANTFDVVAADWLEVWSAKSAQSTITAKKRFLGYLSNKIGNTPIHEIKAAQILEVARLLEADGYGESAHRVIMAASQVFDHAVALGYVDLNPAARLSKALKPVTSEHHPAIIDEAAVGELLRKIDAYGGCPSVKYCLRLIPYIPLRSTELRGAGWAEIDLDKAIWTIPATRAERPQDGGGMKSRREHTVPLSRQVVDMLKALQVYTGNSHLCFPGEKTASQSITGQSLSKALERIGYKGIMTVHGFRSTFSTMMNERKIDIGTDADVIESQLAHVQSNQVRAAYNHADYLEQRRALMQKWADYLDGLRSGPCSSDRKEI